MYYREFNYGYNILCWGELFVIVNNGYGVFVIDKKYRVGFINFYNFEEFCEK